MTLWFMTIYGNAFHWSGIIQYHDLITKLDAVTKFYLLTELQEVLFEHFQWLTSYIWHLRLT